MSSLTPVGISTWITKEGPSEQSPTVWLNHVSPRAAQLHPIPPRAYQYPCIHDLDKVLSLLLGQFSTLMTLPFSFFEKCITCYYFRSIANSFRFSGLEVPASFPSSRGNCYSVSVPSPESTLESHLWNLCFTAMPNKLILPFQTTGYSEEHWFFFSYFPSACWNNLDVTLLRT